MLFDGRQLVGEELELHVLASQHPDARTKIALGKFAAFVSREVHGLRQQLAALTAAAKLAPHIAADYPTEPDTRPKARGTYSKVIP